jgi:hypothetical protein
VAVDECSFDEVNDGDGGRNAHDELMMHSERASKMMIGDAAALSLIGVMVGFVVVVVSKTKAKALHVEAAGIFHFKNYPLLATASGDKEEDDDDDDESYACYALIVIGGGA